MNKTSVLTIAILVALLLPVLSLGMPAQAATPPDPIEIIRQNRNAFRLSGEGLAADSGRLHASLNEWGLTFTPSDADARLGFRLLQVTRGDAVLYSAPSNGGTAPAVLESIDRAGYARPGGIVEAYQSLDFQVEQYFLLRTPLPGSGDLIFEGILSTTLAPRAEGLLSGPARFSLGEGLDLVYGPALARDAAGRETAVALRLERGQVRLAVPGDWLAAASYPVLVDPAIGTAADLSNNGLNQTAPAVATSSITADNYRYMAAWADSRDGSQAIYVQPVAQAGTVYDDATQVYGSANNQQDPAIVYNPTNEGYLVSWYEDGSVNGIRAIRVNYRGIPVGMVINVDGGLSDAQKAPAVAYHTAGNVYLVAYENYATDKQGNIRATVVRADGSMGPSINVATGVAAQTAPAVTYDSVDCGAPPNEHPHLLITWQEDDNIIARACSYNGASLSCHDSFSIAQTAYREWNPDLAFRSVDGEGLAVWQRQNDMAAWEIYGQRVGCAYNGEYGPLSTPIQLSPMTGLPVSRTMPRVSYAADVNEYTVVWQRENSAIEAQQVSDWGERMSNFWTVASASLPLGAPVLSWNPDLGQYLALWQEQTMLGGYEIYARRLDNSFAVSVTSIKEQWPAVAYNSQRQEYLAVWSTVVTSENQYIYGQRISSTGSFLGGVIPICTNAVPGCNSNKLRKRLDVAYDSIHDRYLIVWEGEIQGFSSIIEGRQINGDGTDSGYPVVSFSGGSQYSFWPAVTFDAAWSGGQHFVVWETAQVGIYGRAFYPGDSSLGNTKPIYDGSFALGFRPDIATNPGSVDRRFLVVYQEPGGWQDDHINGKYLNSEGTREQNQILLIGDDLDGGRFQPTVTRGDGYYLITGFRWSLVAGQHPYPMGTRLNDGNDVPVCVFNGVQLSNDPVMHGSYTTADVSRQSAAMHGGHLDVTWILYSDDAAAHGVTRVQQFSNCSPDLSAVRTLLGPISTVSPTESWSAIACDGATAHQCLAVRTVKFSGLEDDIYSGFLFR